MKKHLVVRGLFGIPTGIAISFIISLLISFIINDGTYYPVTPRLINITGSELNAVSLQMILASFMGAGSAMASVIWNLETWSIAKQTGVYFIVISIVMWPISFYAGWMPPTVIGSIVYITIFIIIFIIIWMIQYMIWRRKIQKLNQQFEK